VQGLLLGTALLVMAVAPRAVVLQPLSIETLARKADLILQGAVLSKTCQRDATGRIYTRIELQVNELWKGAIPASPFLIVLGGGVLGEEQATVAGQVEYAVGEEVVVFLVRNPRGEGVTLGLTQGKFHVFPESSGSTRFVANPFHGVPPAAAMKLAPQDASSLGSPGGPLTLAELKRLVVEAAR
jgi:hypothetical protein